MQQVQSLVVSSETDGCLFRTDGFRVSGEPAATLSARTFRVADDADEDWQGGFVLEVVALPDELIGFDYPGVTARCSHGPPVQFLLAFDHAACTVTLRLVLFAVPQDVPSRAVERAKSRWKRAIEDAWSDWCKLVRTAGSAPCREYRILVEVAWTSSEPEAHYAIRVAAGDGRTSSQHWFIGDDLNVAAHEFGHLIGNNDEYPGTCDGCPNRPVRDGIMNDQDEWAHPFPRHFYLVARYAGRELCSTFETVLVTPGFHALGGGADVPAFLEDVWCTLF